MRGGALVAAALWLCWAAGAVDAGKVLISASWLQPSHRLVLRQLAGELVRRGHTVVWWEIGLKARTDLPLPAGVEERFWRVDVAEPYIRNLYLHHNATIYDAVWSESVTEPILKTANWLIGLRLCEAVLTTRKADFDKLVAEHFDTAVVDDLYNPCALLHVGLQRTVYVYWSATSMRTETAWSNQSPSPPSYIPVPGTGYTDELDFYQRSFNFLSYMKAIYMHHRIVLRRVDAVLQRHYPGVTEAFYIERNASINLINTPPVFDFARPYMPRVNFVGGLHCRNATKLPKELGKFIDGASDKHGFMLYTTGFAVQWSRAPQHIIDAFVGAFRQRSELRFVWQYDGPPIADLPANVFVAPWLPQQDLLGHAKCAAHLTHGGLNSVVETLWHGVPIVGLPLFTSQYDNLLRATARDAGFILEKQFISERTVVKSIRKISTTPKYKEAALVFQDLLQDVPYTELNHSAFWVEFIMRHQEVPHARSGADHLNVFQYFLIDVLLFLFSCVFLAIVVLWYTVKFTCKGCCYVSKSTYRAIRGKGAKPATTKKKTQ